MSRDLIETYWINKGLNKLDVESMFSVIGESRTRRRSLRIRPTFRMEMRRSVVNVWNLLLYRAVPAKSLGTFKAELDRFKDYGEKRLRRKK